MPKKPQYANTELRPYLKAGRVRAKDGGMAERQETAGKPPGRGMFGGSPLGKSAYMPGSRILVGAAKETTSAPKAAPKTAPVKSPSAAKPARKRKAAGGMSATEKRERATTAELNRRELARIRGTMK